MPGNIQSATGSSSSMKLREESFAKALDAKAQAPALAAFLVSPRYKKRGYALSCHQKRRLSTLFRASARVDERRTALTALHICGGQKRLGLRVRDDEEDGEGDDAEDVGRRAQELRALAARERRASKHLPPTDSSDLEGTFIPVADLSRTIHPSNAHSLERERERAQVTWLSRTLKDRPLSSRRYTPSQSTLHTLSEFSFARAGHARHDEARSLDLGPQQLRPHPVPLHRLFEVHPAVHHPVLRLREREKKRRV